MQYLAHLVGIARSTVDLNDRVYNLVGGSVEDRVDVVVKVFVVALVEVSLRYEVENVRLVSVEPFRRWQTDSQAIHYVLLHHVSKAIKEAFGRGNTISLTKLIQIHSSGNINDEISSLGVI